MRAFFLVLAVVALLPARLFAIENVAGGNYTNGTYNESPPTNTDIPNWNSGWTQPTVQPPGYTYTTGWNYVGSVGGNSAVYLGNGWVITCAHVGPGSMTLNGQQGYNVVAGSTQTFGTVDLVMFQVSPSPGLPTLPIRSTDPQAYTSPVAMLGWGHTNGNRLPTWGYNIVTNINQAISISYVSNGTVYNCTTNDFVTLTGTTMGLNYKNHVTNVTNNYQVVQGDSGGGDFIYNSATQIWELAGINEAGSYPPSSQPPYGSGCVQLDTYAAQIAQILATSYTDVSPPDDTPVLPQWGLIALAGMLVCVAQLRSKAGNF